VLDRALPASADGVRWASDHYGVLARLTFDSAADARAVRSTPARDA
jgi:hypothetical protein